MAPVRTHPTPPNRRDRDGRRAPFTGDGCLHAARWAGQTAACFAPGPSLTAEDVAYVRGRARTIAVTGAYHLAPWADVLYACDPSWWLRFGPKEALPGEAWSLAHPIWTNGYRAKFPQIKFAGLGPAHGLTDRPGAISHGFNSGYQAVTLAVLFGATKIILLGFDLSAVRGKPAHCHRDYPANQPISPYPKFLAAFQTLVEPLRARGVTVLNATRQTALTCFPRVSLAEALPAEEIGS